MTNTVQTKNRTKYYSFFLQLFFLSSYVTKLHIN